MESAHPAGGVAVGELQVHAVPVLTTVRGHEASALFAETDGALAAAGGAGWQENGFVSLGDGVDGGGNGGSCVQRQRNGAQRGKNGLLKIHLNDISMMCTWKFVKTDS